MTKSHERYLLELTDLPTASGCEQRVEAWVRQWHHDRRKRVALRRDRFGNLLLKRREVTSRRPIVFAAHMDHPAFVVIEQRDAQHLVADFRGGVGEVYFKHGVVQLHHGDDEPRRGGRIEAILKGDPSSSQTGGSDRRLRIMFDDPIEAAAGDVLTWDLPPARIAGGRLYAPACDDLAGVAAALAAFETLLSAKGEPVDVRVLLTRAEEVGFIGALGACRSGIMPKGSRIVALENSRSYAESPIGGGPIVRVGDRTSTFDPDLTYRISRIAEAVAQGDAAFAWQRKLMPGGTCEASAYQAMGYAATCLCLPLGNYHNQNEHTSRIDSETISLADYHGLIRLLGEVGDHLDDPQRGAPFRKRLDDLFAQRRSILD